jgi:hypothetical protein
MKDESIAENENTILQLSATSSFSSFMFENLKKNDKSECMIDDCVNRPPNYRSPHPKFGNYYLECDSNQVMLIRQCPVNTKFEQNWCQ